MERIGYWAADRAVWPIEATIRGISVMVARGFLIPLVRVQISYPLFPPPPKVMITAKNSFLETGFGL